MARFMPIDTDLVRALQAGGPDANGQLAERGVSSGNMTPCRHCLTQITEGDPFLILSHRPFPEPQPYAEQGPIFLHVEHCPRYAARGDLPPMLDSECYLIRGYDDEHRIVYGSGRIVATAEIRDAATGMLTDRSISYLHVRSASNNCYLCRIDRA